MPRVRPKWVIRSRFSYGLLSICILSAGSAFAQSSLTEPIAGGTNVAAPAMERALARAVERSFSPLFATTAFTPDPAQNPPSPPKPPGNAPTAPSLGDLGLSPDQTQGSAQEQARLDKRSHMLKMHQRFGLITTAPLVTTVLVSGLAGGKSTSSAGRDLHAVLGTATAGLYLTTAYYAIFAPKIAGTPTRGPIRLHKSLAFIHVPGMILTPILGAIAFDQKSRGEKVHGIASAHGAVGAVTAVAYGLAILSVSVRF